MLAILAEGLPRQYIWSWKANAVGSQLATIPLCTVYLMTVLAMSYCTANLAGSSPGSWFLHLLSHCVGWSVVFLIPYAYGLCVGGLLA